ncbi:hypothetical protein B0O95_103111 [Mycetohabitans endofungorum]|uniref:Transposase n=1 Tax=Mycetohabitans endofungorum TaxID=417203 RepID=A0A2P5KCI3_9BURK|nr:hypothetical protein B0O95_103111 [Mycetohabitans endofungorum]
MKKRFTEEQIIGFLKETEAAMPIKALHRKHDSVTPRSTRGAQSLVSTRQW